MSEPDLRQLLSDWPFEPGRVTVRLAVGQDGITRLQVRVELGVLQLELEGRPDGLRPIGPDGAACESLLHVHRARLAAHVVRHGSSRGFFLNQEECAALRDEAAQYYHRYVALLALERFSDVARDTARNLEVFDLCRDYAETQLDREVLEQFRPYVLMMRARATAADAVRAGHARLAIAAIDFGLGEIRLALEARGRLDRYDTANEVQLLRHLRDSLIPKLPTSQRGELEDRLRAAIAAENYELAAILRDELRQMS